MTNPTPKPATPAEVALFIESIGGLIPRRELFPAHRPAPQADTSDNKLTVSELRCDDEYGHHVLVTGKPRPFFMAGMALTRLPHHWLEMECTIRPGVIVLTGPDYRASAEQARTYYEAFVYDESEDPEFMDCYVLENDANSWWIGED